MHLIREFHRQAAQCRAFAKGARDQESRSTWNRMAERWDKLAEERQAAETQAQQMAQDRPARRHRSFDARQMG